MQTGEVFTLKRGARLFNFFAFCLSLLLAPGRRLTHLCLWWRFSALHLPFPRTPFWGSNTLRTSWPRSMAPSVSCRRDHRIRSSKSGRWLFTHLTFKTWVDSTVVSFRTLFSMGRFLPVAATPNWGCCRLDLLLLPLVIFVSFFVFSLVQPGDTFLLPVFVFFQNLQRIWTKQGNRLFED